MREHEKGRGLWEGKQDQRLEEKQEEDGIVRRLAA